jgi:hypothetical protein
VTRTLPYAVREAAAILTQDPHPERRTDGYENDIREFLPSFEAAGLHSPAERILNFDETSECTYIAPRLVLGENGTDRVKLKTVRARRSHLPVLDLSRSVGKVRHSGFSEKGRLVDRT